MARQKEVGDIAVVEEGELNVRLSVRGRDADNKAAARGKGNRRRCHHLGPDDAERIQRGLCDREGGGPVLIVPGIEVEQIL
jgi:hypothetical protein